MTWRPGPAWLFCPADRPDRYVKALAAADVVVLDLEDAVAPARKAEARQAVAALVESGVYDFGRTVLRVNAADSIEHPADRALVQSLGISRLMLAKAEAPSAFESLADLEVIALLETPMGIENAALVARASGVIALMWGADDLVAGLGGSSSRWADGRYRDVARYARSRTLIAARSHGRLALDAVYMNIPDHDGLRRECEDAVAVGFDATVAIHPDQVAVIRSAYRPSQERVRWAQRLLEHAGEDRGVMTFEGRMVDGPVYAQAERVLQRWHESRPPDGVGPSIDGDGTCDG